MLDNASFSTSPTPTPPSTTPLNPTPKQVLDYASFSVRVPEAEVEQLDTLLRAVTPEKQAWLGLGLGIGFLGLGSG